MRSTWSATIRNFSTGLWDVVVRGVRRLPNPKGWAALAAVGLLAALTSAHATAAATGGFDGDVSAAQAVTCSTGKQGNTLKWLPTRPDSVQFQTAVIAAQHLAPADSSDAKPVPGPKPSANSSSELFGNTKQSAPTLAPPEKLGTDSLPSMPLEPMPGNSSPKASSQGPDVLKKPYVAPEGLAPSSPTKPGKIKPLEREIVSQLHVLEEHCPSPKDLKPISDLNTNIMPSEGDLPHDCPLGNQAFLWRAFAPLTYAWSASGLCHKPLYFEDVQLERYGHMCGPWLQPFASGIQFFSLIPMLPYEMGVEVPTECIYTLGYYRPGDCAPYMLDPIPWSVRGALFEAGGWVGGVFAIP